MRSLLLAGALSALTATACFADGAFWVVGDNQSHKCEIVTSNPTINSLVGGNIWFGDGPYKSLDDAKLARSTIAACPNKVDPPAGDAGKK